MTRDELVSLCLEMPQTYEDYPFDDDTPAIRHTNNKMFALICEHYGRLSVNLKCDPLWQMFKDIIPGYHTNHTHWNTVFVEGDVPLGELKRQIRRSYDLVVKPKQKRAV